MTDRPHDDRLDTGETLVTPTTGLSGEAASSTADTEQDEQDEQEGSTRKVSVEPKLHFGRFVTEGTIGKGGMGVVFRAVDPVIGRPVAIKALRTDHGITGDSENELRSRFELEFKSAGTLSHPNIVTIYDVGQENDTTFIAMELIEGRSLEQLLREGEVLSFERVGELAKGICAGLDYAHEAGIVHRDVKPANILIDANKDRPKITDFGVAKVQSSGLTQTGTVIGTPAYMSPEQILGKDVSGRSDQFSVAVILYQMLTGQLPFGSDAPASILFRIVHNEPTPPHESNADLPAGVSTALAKGLAKDPEDRYESCSDLADEVTRALMGEEPRIASGERDSDSFRSITLSTTEPLRGSGTYSGAASWWRRRAGRRIGLGVFAALLFAALGWTAVASYMGREIIPFDLPAEIPFLEEATELVQGLKQDESPADRQDEPTAAAVPVATTELEATEPEATEPETTAGDATGEAIGEAEAAALPPRTFTIDSDPQGASVRIDGEAVGGRTPVEVSLTPGEPYEVVVELEGHRPSGSTISDIAEEDDDVLFYRLQPDIEPGRIALSRPAGYGPVVLEANGRRLDPTSVAPGSYDLTVRAPENHLTVQRTLTVREGQTTPIELPPLTEVRIIGVSPSGGTATVRIDGGSPIELPAVVHLHPGDQLRFEFSFAEGATRARSLFVSRNVRQIVGSPEEIVTRN